VADYTERAMSEAECAVRPDWQTWAMECLTDQQVGHCGHLGSALIVDGCEWCAELSMHATEHTAGTEGYLTCDLCKSPRCGRCQSNGALHMWWCSERPRAELPRTGMEVANA
jgi:hypothetical protein